MMRKTCLAAVLCAGLLLLSGCTKQEAKTEPAPLQTGYFDVSGLTAGESYTQSVAGNFEMADENAEVPTVELRRYTGADGAEFSFDNAGRLRSYSDGKESGTRSFTESLKSEDVLRAACDDVLSSYLPDYSEFTEITSQYYEDGSVTYNLAMEHIIADGIADYALIRLDEKGAVHDLSISYADLDGDSADQNFVTDDDKAYFEEQVKPYLTALQDYSAEVTYISYKHLNGKVYAFYEVTYTDGATGIEAGSKRVIFVQ